MIWLGGDQRCERGVEQRERRGFGRIGDRGGRDDRGRGGGGKRDADSHAMGYSRKQLLKGVE